MTDVEDSAEMKVLLVGGDGALLEGLAQSFAALGYAPQVTETLHEAREAASADPPLLAVVERALAVEASADALAIPLAPGGALVLFHGTVDERPSISPTLQRSVLADLTLPLERNRLIALAQHVSERVRATGRTNRQTPPEQEAF
jgi:DNA-binding NtrC family response regulator